MTPYRERASLENVRAPDTQLGTCGTPHSTGPWWGALGGTESIPVAGTAIFRGRCSQQVQN